MPVDECKKIAKLFATVRCHPKDKADNRVVAEGEDGYFNPPSADEGLPVGIHFMKRFFYHENIRLSPNCRLYPLSELYALRAGSRPVSPTLRPVGSGLRAGGGAGSGAGSRGEPKSGFWGRILYYRPHSSVQSMPNREAVDREESFRE